MHKDEECFFVEFHQKILQSIPVRDIVNKSLIGKKKAWLYLAKWGNKGLYDYGLTLELGTLTEEGKKRARALEESYDRAVKNK